MTATSVLHAVGGRWAEPVCGRIARPLLGHLSGTRSVRRMGLKWELDMSHNHERRVYAIGSYESAVKREALKVLHRDDCVLDVGANIGTFALPIARRGYRVLAVEAATDSARRLDRHVALNALEGLVVVQHLALGSTPGSVQLREGMTEDSGLRTIQGLGSVVERVEMLDGDSLLRSLGMAPALVKIDVEGAELDVIQGLQETLSRARAVIVEVVDMHQRRAGRSTASVVEALAEFGYAPQQIRARGLADWTGTPANLLFSRH